MSQEIRRELIGRNLGIKPINHGQIYTFQIALPENSKQNISLERKQAIENSLLEHRSNLVSLIVRRTSSYENEDIEYELIYGSAWLQAAQTLNVDMLWAWVFDMTDEQALLTQAEMIKLLESSEMVNSESNDSDLESFDSSTTSDSQKIDIEVFIERKLQIATDSIQKSVNFSLEKLQNTLDEKLKNIQYRIDSLSNGINEIPQLLDYLSHLNQQLNSVSSPRSKAGIHSDRPKINLLQASDDEIKDALEQINTQEQHIEAAISSIKFWKSPGRKLTWRNLEKSAKAKTGSQFKIQNFAEKTYARLQAIGEIEDS